MTPSLTEVLIVDKMKVVFKNSHFMLESLCSMLALLEAHVMCTLHVPLYFIILEKFVTSESGLFSIHIHPIYLQIYLQPPSLTNHVPIIYLTY